MTKDEAPTISAIKVARKRLASFTIETPMVSVESAYIRQLMNSKFLAKLELFQRTGTFKARGAVNNILALGDGEKKITAVSAGNHAIATAYAATVLNANAKVVMQASANPYRVEQTKSYGAEVVMASDGKTAFAKVREIEKNEGRVFIHPFEGYHTTEATGCIGMELVEQDSNLDAVVVAIGGGGLASGVSAAVKQLKPDCLVFGVEPEGAAAMRASFDTGNPTILDQVTTIADSLAPPMTTPYALSICRQYLDDIVLVSDDQIAAAAAIIFSDLKLVVEPAGAAALAGAIGPLRSKLMGKRVGFIVCGSNIDRASFNALVVRGEAALKRDVFTV